MKKNDGINGEVQRPRRKRDVWVFDVAPRPELKDRMARAVKATGRNQSDIIEEALEIHLRKLAPSTRKGVNERVKQLAAALGKTEAEVTDLALITYAAAVGSEAERRLLQRGQDGDGKAGKDNRL